MRITGAERVLGIIGYLPVLFIIPVKLKRDSMFVQFHARQGGVLFVTWLVIALVLFIAAAFIPTTNAAGESSGGAIVQTIVFAIVFLLTGIYLLLMLTGIIKVLLGERYRMPVIADIALMLRL